MWELFFFPILVKIDGMLVRQGHIGYTILPSVRCSSRIVCYNKIVMTGREKFSIVFCWCPWINNFILNWHQYRSISYFYFRELGDETNDEIHTCVGWKMWKFVALPVLKIHLQVLLDGALRNFARAGPDSILSQPNRWWRTGIRSSLSTFF